jgi:transposase, IS5 family
MTQPGFFDLNRRYESLDAKPDPLVALNELIPWESFRTKLRSALEETGQRATREARKSAAGRKPWDEVLMFKVLVLQALYNLADDNLEYLIRDRLSFMRFLGLGLRDRVPDAKTVWLYREALVKTGRIEALFADFDNHLKENGYLAMGGQIIDATIVPVPKNRNNREANEAIKAGEMPKGWESHPAKRRQKDRDARWTKKHGRSYYGYKNHISIDRRHKFVRRYTVTDAARHDSQEFDAVLDDANTCRDVWADSAYRSAETEEKLAERHFRSRVHRRAKRNHGLSEREEKANQTRSKVRARVEHVFGHQVTAMGGKLVRTMGIVRAKVKIGMRNLSYNMQRFTSLERSRGATA